MLHDFLNYFAFILMLSDIITKCDWACKINHVSANYIKYCRRIPIKFNISDKHFVLE